MADEAINFPSLGSTGPLSSGPESSLFINDRGDPELVNSADKERFLCPVHHGLLRDPRQTPCGHRLCASCVEDYLKGSESRRCPVGESDCEPITLQNVLRDNSCSRDMKKLMVYCLNKSRKCPHKCKYHELKTHIESCEYEDIACIYASRGCTEKSLRKDSISHTSACPFRPVQCKFCNLEINHNQIQHHESEVCPEKETGCPFGCGEKKVKRKEIMDHRDVCPIRPMDCKFKAMGCSFAGKKDDVEKHEKHAQAEHLELLTRKVAELELKSMDTQSALQTITVQRDELQQSLSSMRSQDPNLQAMLHQLEGQGRDFRLKLVGLLERVIVLERRVPELAERRKVEEIERSITTINQRLAQVQTSAGSGTGGPVTVPRYGTINDMADAFSTQLSAHDRQLGVHDVRMAEMDLRFQLLETASYDGMLVWKIRDYERRKRDAVNGRTLSLYSQPFYTGRFGYKMCARVYLNGDGMGKTTHMSLFFVIMRGEYDALLNWPFRQKVTLTLLDQSAEKRHLSDHFQPDPTSSSFQRPSGEMNVASGCPLFVSHAVLENPANGYVRDDTIFIKIAVDTIPNPF
ncbi:TNF receptor-associated factor 3-like [Pomacea canaliculata]|nr:TNF receptor-associated factor 3-like [Pomacea canaliculata]XP_025104198.1 TNF receptor-associated factor 3-like [Pomacea canaliculata]XP_025104199.1 TNF receptor-associated factor 3-like [Pomacea canaliculata]XP_025104200.1 TNF receptor-associated factor 3-like [Pomacea canaliculata]XP_025104201.1 TNF receptor-associated factor 3-like [Pomacea canaliculata]